MIKKKNSSYSSVSDEELTSLSEFIRSDPNNTPITKIIIHSDENHSYPVSGRPYIDIFGFHHLALNSIRNIAGKKDNDRTSSLIYLPEKIALEVNDRIILSGESSQNILMPPDLKTTTCRYIFYCPVFGTLEELKQCKFIGWGEYPTLNYDNNNNNI